MIKFADDFTLSMTVKGSNDYGQKPLLVDKQSILLRPKTRFLGGKWKGLYLLSYSHSHSQGNIFFFEGGGWGGYFHSDLY